MLKVSELNARTKFNKERKNRKRSGNSNPTQRSRDAVNDRAKAERRKQKVEKLAAQAATVGKVTKEGKRVCMWDECTTILSAYNDGECCGMHQRAWNERKGASFFF